MKKIITLALIAIFTVTSISAQTQSKKKKKYKSGLEFEYIVDDNSLTNPIGANLVLGFLALGADFSSYSDENSGVYDATQWGLSAGINHRFNLLGFLYLEARLGAYYKQTSTSFVYESLGYAETIESSGYGCYANPRVGLRLAKGFSVTGGYRFNFYDFDINTDSMTRYLTVGVGYLF
ncbi:MAG: hypothetical protein SNF68_00225 [Rikenellaceae bacterium]